MQLNLLPDGDDCWQINLNKKGITIFPSVYRKHRCKSHFSIVMGDLEWY
ncbi:DUF6527 family protein [Chryseosolibacter histidini]